MKQQVVVLAVTYDETQVAPPSKWDFAELLEVPREHVSIELTGTLVPITEE